MNLSLSPSPFLSLSHTHKLVKIVFIVVSPLQITRYVTIVESFLMKVIYSDVFNEDADLI